MTIRYRLAVHLGVAGLAILLVSGTGLRADTAQVMVASLSAPVPGIAELDYVAPGTTIDLGTSTTIVLDHLATCKRETITGGIVQVGPQSSSVTGGTVFRTQTDCNGHLHLEASQSGPGGGQVLRGIGRNK
jgi:hypothetical protein